MWAGFLSWPLVKQTSEVGGQRRSLVLTASFTSSTAFSTSAFNQVHQPGISLRHSPPLHLSPSPDVPNKSRRVITANCRRAATLKLLQRPCPNRQPAHERLLTQRSALYRLGGSNHCHPGHRLQWDSPVQNAQEHKPSTGVQTRLGGAQEVKFNS